MIEIKGSAAYVRNPDARTLSDEQSVLQSLHNANDVDPEASLRIWELLETPQTVETICRVLGAEFDLPPAASVEGVKIVLANLYRDDLIQVSPDS